ncbi:peptidase C14 caspase catalytic subunit p20 [Nostoc sp. NIES-4103]|nr:peptidase C14 caspase catalytic subunit p20 [Nostoc sp. NIES-4103]
MLTPDELKVLIEKLAAGIATDEEIEILRKADGDSDQIILQIAQNITNVNHAQNSQFGDRIYLESEALQSLNQHQTPSQEVQRQHVRQFLEEIENSLKFITLSHKQQPISIKDQYIPVQVTLERHYQNEVESTYIYTELDYNFKSFYKPKKKSKEAQQEQVDWQVFKEQHKTIMVLANPGMGKSTLLWMETISNAEQARQEIENGQNIEDIVFPLYLKLADLADSPKNEEVFDSISRIIQRDYPNTAPINLVLLQQKLKLEQCLLLLDGLDEVLAEQRIYLSQKLNRFANNYPCQIIGTSRIVGYHSGTFINGVKEVEIVPFDLQKTGQYVKKWFNNSNTVSELMRELYKKPQIRSLAQNPLLLSLICSLYQEKSVNLPTRRCQVYEMVVDYMLGNWCSDNSRQIPDSGWIAAKQDLLGEIAYKFSCERKDIFTIQDLRSKIEKYLKNTSISTDFINKNTSQLIAELSQQDGILQNLSGDNKKYLFLHRTFQEYFTALHLKHLIETDINRGISLVKTNLYKYEWHETLSLLAGLLDDPIPLFKTISLEKDDIFHSLLLLSGECIAECKEQSDPFMQKIIEEIYELWQSRPYIVFITVVVERIAYTNNIMQEKLLNIALKHSSSEVRCEAVKILGKTANSRNVEALIATSSDRDIYVRLWSLVSLGCIEEETAIEACVIQALNENNPNVIKALFASFKMNQNSQLIIKILIKYLKYINDLSFQIFISKFQSYVVQCCIDYKHREYYIDDFHRIHNFNIINLLLECCSFLHSIFIKETIVLFGELGDDDVDVVNSLMQVLEPLEDKFNQWLSTILEITNESLDIFLNNQNYYDDEIKNILTYKIIQELRKTDTQEIINQSIKKIDFRYCETRKKIVIALGQIGNAKAINILKKAINDLDGEVRVEAATALIKINSLQAFETLKKAVNNSNNSSSIKREVIMALATTDIPQAIELLTQFIEDQDRDIRWRAVTALGEIGNSQSVKILIGYLNHSDNDVRREAFAALAEISTPEVIKCLIHALKQQKHEDKKWVAAALGKIKCSAQELKHYKNVEVVESLIDSLNASDSYVRRWIAVALGKIRCSKSITALIQALSHPDAAVQQEAIAALKHIGTSKVLKSLVQSFTIDLDDPDIYTLARILAVRVSMTQDNDKLIPLSTRKYK